MHDPIQVDKQGYSDLYDHTLCKYTYLGYEPPEPVICLAVASSETDALVKVTQKDVFVKGYHGEWDVNEIEIPGYIIEVRPV